MHVRLVSHSRPTEEFAHLGIQDAQELVAFCARVSNPANQFNTETSERLIRYLIRHQHWSPLEMVSACLEITTTRDIARQILRHRSFSFQEFSQRYADPTAELAEAFVLRDARFQDHANRQNSVDPDPADVEQQAVVAEWQRAQSRVLHTVKQEYEWAIRNGIAKEQARAILPEGLIVSRLYMNGTLRSWIHFIELRTGHGTQREHMAVARACASIISAIFPVITNLSKN